MVKDRKKRLDVSVYPKMDKELHRVIYRIVIDGDVFWADSYDHALLVVFKILIRDEFSKSKIF